MNPRQPCQAAQQLLRLRTTAQLPLTWRTFSKCPRQRAFTSSVPGAARNGHSRDGGPTIRVPAETHRRSVRPRSRIAALAALAAGVGLLSIAFAFYPAPRTAFDAHYATAPPVAASSGFESQPCPSPLGPADNRDPKLPRFRITEVRKHGADSEHPWVIHADKVYDITDWIPAHPGGQVILQAAGGSIDPYWDIFTIHKSQYVHDILSQYLIGYVDQADLIDGKPAQDQIEDPFQHDPERHPSLVTRTAKPRNAEPPGEALGAHFLTPADLFYVRNHMWVPHVEQDQTDDHRLTVELLDGTIKEYTLGDLKTKFPRHKVTATLQCSGNRRSHMSRDSGRKANGLAWDAGAISNATWEGVLLSDVLAHAGLDLEEARNGLSETQHVHFTGLEAYGSSIPIKKAVDPLGDVLLAYGMNEKPLPRDHGSPLRAIVPGYVAARSVKWLNRIALSDEESTSQWQRKDYKCFGPNETKVDWDAAPAIQELPVQSAITTLQLGKRVGSKAEPDALANDEQDGDDGDDGSSGTPGRRVALSGYAFSGGGRSIIRVDVSLDGGASWDQARLLPDCVSKNGTPSPCHGHGAWSWKRWTYDGSIPLDKFTENPGPAAQDAASAAANAPSRRARQQRCTTVLVKATDDAYNTQPESHAATWNLRGNLATAWHKVQVCADCSRASAGAKHAHEKP